MKSNAQIMREILATGECDVEVLRKCFHSTKRDYKEAYTYTIDQDFYRTIAYLLKKNQIKQEVESAENNISIIYSLVENNSY